MDNKKYAEVVDQLAALRKASLLELFFSPRMEQEYQYSLAQWYRDCIRASSLLAALLLLGSHLVEWYAHAALPASALLLRATAIAALVGTYFYTRRSRSLRLQHWLVTLDGLLVVAAFLLIAHSSDPPIKQIYYTNIFFVEIVVFAFIRLPINFASTTALMMVLMVSASLYLDQMDVRSSSYLLFLLLSGTLLCMMIAFRMEKSARENFLQAQLIQLERDQLRQLNQQLSEQLALDRVTRLHNRMTFEDALLAAWNPSRTRQRIMMLGIHIENFGRFNELKGQDAGDDLLRDVARQIRSVLVDCDGIAARISGARFVVLFTPVEEQRLKWCLESLRSKLLRLPVFTQADMVHQHIYPAWGGVNLLPDPDRDPRGIIDRMFSHLSPVEDLELTSEHCVSASRRSAFF